ncbi:hypothetical protein fugu_007364 [Takifugu bimaculatus]|uniref:Uncharacterized protein n=1 Tax=Takifugu bimaculatus TaxID=433685 RepID=A0A4Z2B442_9TELE|nr:hypothetical protein fugu_007364 [Takifugu bimaculatus]
MAANTVSQITWLSGLPETPGHLQFPGSSFPGGARNRIVQLHFPSERRLNSSGGIPYKLIFKALKRERVEMQLWMGKYTRVQQLPRDEGALSEHAKEEAKSKQIM